MDRVRNLPAHAAVLAGEALATWNIDEIENDMLGPHLLMNELYDFGVLDPDDEHFAFLDQAPTIGGHQLRNMRNRGLDESFVCTHDSGQVHFPNRRCSG